MLDRGVRPIGLRSTRTSLLIAVIPSTIRPSVRIDVLTSKGSSSASTGSRVWPRDSLTKSTSTGLTSVDFPDPDTPVTDVRTPKGKLTSNFSRLFLVTPVQPQPSLCRSRRMSRRPKPPKKHIWLFEMPPHLQVREAHHCRGFHRHYCQLPDQRQRSSRHVRSRRSHARPRIGCFPPASICRMLSAMSVCRQDAVLLKAHRERRQRRTDLNANAWLSVPVATLLERV